MSVITGIALYFSLFLTFTFGIPMFKKINIESVTAKNIAMFSFGLSGVITWCVWYFLGF